MNCNFSAEMAVHDRYKQHFFEPVRPLNSDAVKAVGAEVFWLYRCTRCGVDIGGVSLQAALESATRFEMYDNIVCPEESIRYLHRK